MGDAVPAGAAPAAAVPAAGVDVKGLFWVSSTSFCFCLHPDLMKCTSLQSLSIWLSGCRYKCRDFQICCSRVHFATCFQAQVEEVQARLQRDHGAHAELRAESIWLAKRPRIYDGDQFESFSASI